MIFMSIRNTLIASLISVALPVAAAFETISLAYEISLSNFRVPVTPSSAVSLQKCDDCEQISIRVTPGTTYAINDEVVTLEQFRKTVFDIRDRENETIIVLHHLESDTVLSVSVTI